MLLRVDQLKNDELYFFSEDPVHAYYQDSLPKLICSFLGLFKAHEMLFQELQLL